MGVIPDIDLLDATLYGDAARPVLHELRRASPVYRDERNDLWGVVSHRGVRAVGGSPAVFSSAQGSRIESGPMPWMIDMDAPDHTRRRMLVNRGFTPARVRDQAARIRALTDGLIDAVSEAGECDFRHDLAAPLPLVVICDMLGIPAEDHARVLDVSDRLLGSLEGDPAKLEAAAAAFGEWDAYARALVADRRVNPTDDLASVFVHAELDGERLDDAELVMEILLLLLGGDETTRNVACGGLEQLLAHPEQCARLRAEPSGLPVAVEELLRWVSPIKNMARTAVVDTEIEGQPVAAGDRVLLLFEAANFDETQFDDPDRFAVDRAPNDHVAFGFGAHFCLGASLARLELRILFEQVLARLPDLALAGAEPPPRSIIGISSMPVTFTPTAPVARAVSG